MGLVAASLLAALLAQDTAAQDTSAEALSADFIVLEKAYRALHPGLDRYNTPEELERIFGKLKEDWRRDLSMKDAYLRLSEFTARVKCGHTYANFFNQSKAVQDELFNKPRKLPFLFRWIDGVMVVTRDLSDVSPLQRGTEILSIDGIPSEEILAKLLLVARADGNNDGKRVADMEVLGSEGFEAFDVFFPLYYGDLARRKLRIRKPGGGVEDVSTECLSFAEKQERLGTVESSADSPLWSLVYPRNDVAVWRMPTWVLYNSKWDATSFFNQTFDELVEKKVPNLVLDLRGNEGGDSVGDYFVSRLIEKKISFPGYRSFTKYRSVPSELRQYLNTWDNSFYDWGDAAVRQDSGLYELVREGEVVGFSWEPARPRYTGRVFVLIGPENSSATFQFAAAVKQFQLGTLVGRTTGGSLRGINGGSFFFLTLPNSRLEVDIPLIAGMPVSAQPDSGVEPDVPVKLTTGDIASGRDVELAKVLELIDR